ncbi:MAG: DUF1842 domain-containing protein [Caulobacter sp.]
MADDIEVCGETAVAVRLVVGRLGMPGAPILQLELQIDGDGVGGVAEINQAVIGGRHRFDVSGQVAQTEQGRQISLSGQFTPAGQPPADFTAVLSVGDDWSGAGRFDYLQTHVQNVPVKAQG